ncbi:MAG: DNA-binding response regulator [Nitrospirae bacterium]|nr:DNA-binding response regulator [Nitrospirota bacterium]
MEKYSIVLADDHVLFREGLKLLIGQKPDLEVVGEAGDGLEILELLSRINPNMIILDISMPNMRGIEAIHEIQIIRPDVKLLILTMHKDKDYLNKTISAGAHGYVLKEDAHKELFSAIEKVRNSKLYVSPKLSEELAEDWARIQRHEVTVEHDQELLTNREREVVKLIAEGKTSKDIAALLHISNRTVEGHRAKIMEKLNLKNTADLIKYAIKKGYTE